MNCKLSGSVSIVVSNWSRQCLIEILVKVAGNFSFYRSKLVVRVVKSVQCLTLSLCQVVIRYHMKAKLCTMSSSPISNCVIVLAYKFDTDGNSFGIPYFVQEIASTVDVLSVLFTHGSHTGEFFTIEFTEYFFEHVSGHVR